MAAFNGARWIVEQVQSILCQVEVEVHLVISDGGSTDNTAEIVERLSADHRVSTFSVSMANRSAAQNFLSLIRGVSANSYDFVSFADQDDVWFAHKLSRACAKLTSTGSDGYSSASTAFWSDGRQKELTQVSNPTPTDFLFEGAGQGCTFVITSLFYCKLQKFLRDELTEMGALHYHDWAIYALSRSWKLNWTFDQTPGLKYRQHAKNDTGARTGISGIRKRIRLLKTGWYAQQLFAIAHICRTASPSDPVISEWYKMLHKLHGPSRTFQIARFCARGGRRRMSDRLVVLGAVILGWI